MPPFVILRHSLPDGSSHYDWLFDYYPNPIAPSLNHPNDLALLAFRSSQRPDETTLPDHPVQAVQLPSHRRLYLTYEGPLPPPSSSSPSPGDPTEDRGAVKRVLWGDYQAQGTTCWDGPDGTCGHCYNITLSILGGEEGTEIGRPITLRSQNGSPYPDGLNRLRAVLPDSGP